MADMHYACANGWWRIGYLTVGPPCWVTLPGSPFACTQGGTVVNRTIVRLPFPRHLMPVLLSLRTCRDPRFVTPIMACLLLAILQTDALGQSLEKCSNTNAQYPNGKFEQSMKIELLRDGRLVKLLEDARYIDPCGTEWDAPAGSIVNGASIPQVVWSLVGGPFEGKYRDASVIHDVACESKSRHWTLAHEAFYFAMLARETPQWQAKIMYAAVYHFGPRWRDPVSHTKPPKRRLRQKDFAALAAAIRKRESSSGAVDLPPISLTEIEDWRPE
jgi:Protein of unknown function (DUF1353)